jgi:type IV secretory pathway VirD2 relaxase
MARDVLQVIEAAQEAAGLLELRTTEARQATKDLKRVMGEREAMVRRAVREEVDAAMRAAANDAFKGMASDVELVAKEIERTILKRLEAIYDAYVEGEQGQPTVAELMAARQRIRKGIEAAEADRKASGRPPG